MSDQTPTCPFCGARVAPDAAQCNLCGASLASDDASSEPPEPEEEAAGTGADASPDPNESEGETSVPPSVYCNQCGWENPDDARFCSRCGEELQDLSDAAAPPGTRPVAADLPTGASAGEASADETPAPSVADEEGDSEQRAVGQQITLVVGGALVLIVGLFFGTRWSQQYDWGAEGASGPQASQQQETPSQSGGMPGGAMEGGGSNGATGAPSSESEPPADLASLVDASGERLEGAMADQADSLQAQIEQAPDGERRALQAELVNLLIGAGAPGRAASVQAEVADASESVEDRRRAADLLYKWMRKLQGEDNREQALEVARHVADAYGAVADQRPDDLDARTRMGEAYLLTNSPMRGIRAINDVVEEDSTFVPARFQKGLAFLQINRLDQALQEFEAVKRHASEDEPFYKQAQRAIDVIQEQRAQGSGGSSEPAPSPQP